MANPEYYQFMRSVRGAEPDPLGKEVETKATDREIGWWKQFQISRAIHHMRYGRSTSVEIHLLKTHNIPISGQARLKSKRNFYFGA